MTRIQGILFPSTTLLVVVLAATVDAQVRESYYERPDAVTEQVDTMQETGRLRLLAADRLTATIENAMEAGRYRDAVGFAEAQLALRAGTLGEDHPDMIPSLIAHGFACWRQSRFADGERSLEAARDIIAVHLGTSHPEMARCLDLLGLCRMARGFHEEAKRLYFDALDIALETCGEAHEMTIACYDDLGAVFQEQSRLAESEPFRRRALALSRRVNGTEHCTTARLTHNLGKLVIRFGEYRYAESLFREALDIRIRLLGEEHPDVAASMEFLGSVLTHQRRLDEALPYLRRALEIRRNTLGTDHHLTAMSIGRLAHVSSVRGDLDECLRFLHEELAIRRRVYGNEHLNVVRCLRGIASVHTRRGEYNRAERYLAQARVLVDKPALETFTGWYVDSYLGRIAMLRGDYRRAEQIFAGITDGYEKARLNEADCDRRTTHAPGGNPYLNLAALRLLNDRPDGAWPALERYLARGLFELLVAFGDNPLSATEIAREDSLNSVLLGLEQQLAVLRVEQNRTGPSSALTNRFENTRTRLLETQAARGTFRDYMGDKYPVAEGAVFPLGRVQASLDGTTALVGWLDVAVEAERPAAWVYVIRSSGPVVWAALPAGGDGELNSLPGSFREAVAGAAAWPYRVTATDKTNWLAGRLYRQRLAPVEAFLSDIANVVVIPTGVMQGVPVEALIDDDGRHAGDRFTISYTASGTVYSWLRERETAATTTMGRTLIVGAPVIVPSEVKNSRTFVPLPSSRRELESIASCIEDAVVLSDSLASEQALVAMSGTLDRFATIHLATHAVVDADLPERSYLLLSQDNLPDPLRCAMEGRRIYDGRLTTREIIHEWNLDANLVTLSACRTALGKQAGGEGFVGFAHAFLQTGARSVIVSLWEVDDEATSLLMGRFYKNLAGTGDHAVPGARAEALAGAKRWLRDYVDDNGARPFRHPAYWAGFILIGARG